MIYYYRMDPPLCSGGPPPHTRFTLPATRERHLSMPEIGEKERDYLFKVLYKLKSNDLISSLRSQSSLVYPQMHSLSFSLCPVQGTISQKKKSKSVVLLCPSCVIKKNPQWLPRLSLNPMPIFLCCTISDSSHNWPQLPAFPYFSSFTGLP